MASDLDNAVSRRSAILVELAAIVAGSGPAKPNVSKEGQSIDWQGYRKSLYEELAALNTLISQLGGGYEVESQGMSGTGFY